MAKFLVVHPTLDIYGGGERVCHHIIKALLAHGQSIELLSFDFNEDTYREIMGERLPSGITVHTLGKRDIVEAKPPLSMYKRRRNIVKLLDAYKAIEEFDYTFSTQTLSAFETTLFSKAKKNFAYVHFPEIPYVYEHSKRSRRLYMWPYKKMLERHISDLDLLFCNSCYTKSMIEKYWGRFKIAEPVIAYPPVKEVFWSNKPLNERVNRVVYIARFVPQKNHEVLKQLAEAFPQLEFVSLGLLRETEQAWFENFSKDLPPNYTLKTNISETEKIQLLQDSTIYCHLMEGEHFGIAPMEALASGCVTLTHKSGGGGDFIPDEFRWSTIDDLKEKIALILKDNFEDWNKKKELLQNKISVLRPAKFEEQIWVNVSKLLEQP